MSKRQLKVMAETQAKAETPPSNLKRAIALDEKLKGFTGYLVKEEIADRLRKEPRTIERWMRQGIIPFLKLVGGNK